MSVPVRSTRQIQGSVLNRQFAFCGGGFSLWLCLEDMFLVHDRYLGEAFLYICLLYTSPSPRDGLLSRMPSSA